MDFVQVVADVLAGLFSRVGDGPLSLNCQNKKRIIPSLYPAGAVLSVSYQC